MLTQKEIADHLGISQPAVAKQLKTLGIDDWQSKTLDEIRLAYIDRLRATASGYASLDGTYDLNRERVMTERVDRELKLFQLAEKKRELVNVAELWDELNVVFAAFRQELLSRDDKLKTELDTLYGVDIDVSILNEHTNNALKHLSGYLEGHRSDPAQTRSDPAAPGPVGDYGVG
jgi:predicted transcriptional regulator